MNNRTLSAVTLGSLIISLAVGLIVYVLTDRWIMILWTTMLIFGIALFVLSFMYPRESGKFGPSAFTYIMAWGVIAAAVGTVGILSVYTDISIWILAAILLIVLAVEGMTIAFMNGKKEGQ
ncbi:MAG: hypothetical protein FWG96_00665 [Methanomassiliicoccaceae archaeon]|nr:hypothetical protein [Methanomassiliicoccaceae archaeon]